MIRRNELAQRVRLRALEASAHRGMELDVERVALLQSLESRARQVLHAAALGRDVETVLAGPRMPAEHRAQRLERSVVSLLHTNQVEVIEILQGLAQPILPTAPGLDAP